MAAAPALVLFAHGARDPRWAAPFHALQRLLRERLPGTEVRLAFLELMSPTLPETAAQLAEAGCEDLLICPVFLGQGGHLRREFPALVDAVRARHPHLSVRTAPPVGEAAEVLLAMADWIAAQRAP